MSIVTGKRRAARGRGPFSAARVLAPVLGLVALVGCETFEENPSPNPAVVSSQDLDAQPYPNLSQVPDKPPPVTPEQIRASTAAGLEADRSNAQYTAPLTASGTTVQSAAPPAPTAVATTAAEETTAAAATTTAAATSAANTAATSAATAASTAAPSAAATTAAQPVPAAPSTPSSGRPTSLDQTTTAVAAAGVPTSAPGRSTIPSGAATQAASPYTGSAAIAGTSAAAASPAAATASAAAQPTATAAGVVPGPTGTPSASKTPGAAALASSRRQRRSNPTPTTTGPQPAVVSSAGVVSSPVPAALPTTTAALPLGPGPGASAAAAAAPPLVPQQGTIGSGAVQLVAVIYFANGSAALDGRDVAVLREVAAIQRQYGGVVRVIGHASSRTAVLPQERHQFVNLQVSFDRAESVGQTLLRSGLPAEALVMEGVSDRQPVYHEFMVTGEAGNRRAEIFLEY